MSFLIQHRIRHFDVQSQLQRKIKKRNQKKRKRLILVNFERQRKTIHLFN